jgi:hypothetical protein
VLPEWLRDLAEHTWQQLGALVDDPTDPGVPEQLDANAEAYAAHYAEAVAVSLDEARHRERRGTAAGAAKIRGRLKAERARRKEAEARLEDGQGGQSTKRALGQIFGRSRSGNRDDTNS